nr:MAG TPA: hypothetical protein [Caudoviricetes sp.]DAW34831.1 MAG TPA: hypothetical protein [Caudoviricetes sp.]
MSRRRNKHLSGHICCEQCNNCSGDDNGKYICNQKAVIEGYMPTDHYFWCKGELFRKKVQKS